MRHFVLKMIVSPRPARDKYRGNPKETRFLATPAKPKPTPAEKKRRRWVSRRRREEKSVRMM